MKEEEKQQIINQIVDDCNGMVDGDQAFWVYDAGYRKQVSRTSAIDTISAYMALNQDKPRSELAAMIADALGYKE